MSRHIFCDCISAGLNSKKCDSVDLSPTFESNFDEVVKNIALESKKSNYNPEIDMNWCNLPMEMRLECLKHLNFKTRCGFRAVSKSEKSLFDSKKYKFEHLQITFNLELGGSRMLWMYWDIFAKSGNEESEIQIRTDNRLNEKCLSAIFKYAEVKNFLFTVRHCTCEVDVLKQLAQFAPFPFKRVAVFDDRFFEFFIQNCPNLEKIDMSGWLPYKEILELPSLLKIKEFKLRDVSESDLLEFLPELVEKWIDNDVEIGKSVQFHVATLGIIDKFAEKFADRIIEKTDKEVRIRMNNEKTQILMRSLESEEYNWGAYYCSCKVIPIDMPKSEYANGDGWIQAVFEKTLKILDELENAMEYDAEDQAIWGDKW